MIKIVLNIYFVFYFISSDYKYFNYRLRYMKVNYLYESGPFGSYKNAKPVNKDYLHKLAAEAIFEKDKEEIMEVYVNDIKELMDTLVDSIFGSKEEKYKICNRYVTDESPDAYGIGARIHAVGTTVTIKQLLSFQTSLITERSITYYLCPEEFTFWENEEKKLQKMFPKYTFKIVLDWVYSSTDDLQAGKKVNSDVDNLEHCPFPYPLEEYTFAASITLGFNVTLDMFIKYWNRYISKYDCIKMIKFDNPSINSLDITIPTDFKTKAIQIIGGDNLTDISGASKYLIGNKEVTYNLNGFRDFGSRKSNVINIKEKYKQNPVFEQATNGVLSLDNLTYLFDNSTNGRLLFPGFTYNINTGKGRLFDTSYNYNKNSSASVTEWFDKDGFKSAIDVYLKEQGKK